MLIRNQRVTFAYRCERCGAEYASSHLELGAPYPKAPDHEKCARCRKGEAHRIVTLEWLREHAGCEAISGFLAGLDSDLKPALRIPSFDDLDLDDDGARRRALAIARVAAPWFDEMATARVAELVDVIRARDDERAFHLEAHACCSTVERAHLHVAATALARLIASWISHVSPSKQRRANATHAWNAMRERPAPGQVVVGAPTA